MPIEISEIGVRLSVGSPAPGPDAARNPAHARPSPLSREQMDEIVRACVAEALALIRMTQSR